MIATIASALINDNPIHAYRIKDFGVGRRGGRWGVVRNLQIKLRQVVKTDAERYALLSHLCGKPITSAYELRVADALAITALPLEALKEEMERVNAK